MLALCLTGGAIKRVGAQPSRLLVSGALRLLSGRKSEPIVRQKYQYLICCSRHIQGTGRESMLRRDGPSVHSVCRGRRKRWRRPIRSSNWLDDGDYPGAFGSLVDWGGAIKKEGPHPSWLLVSAAPIDAERRRWPCQGRSEDWGGSRYSENSVINMV